tara:strand:- start:188 stop:670 length:483 start_codon:yes stop_codon:yes gene_type:complete
MSVSDAVLTGNLINVELNYSNNGNAYARGKIAISSGPDSDETQWYDFICFGDLAQNVDETFKSVVASGGKSMRVIAKGKLEISYYESGEDNTGKSIKRQSTKIVAEEVGVSMKYAQLGNVSKGYATENTSSVQSEVKPASSLPEPEARPLEELTPDDAPF